MEFDGGSIVSLTSMTSLMTPPPFTHTQTHYDQRTFTRHPRPTRKYKRVYLITTVGRDNLEREILSDLEEPDLNLVMALGMSFIRANFRGKITRAGALLIEWAWLRGLEFTYKEKRLMAHAHWEIWQQQGLSGELYHLKRSCCLFEEILDLPAYVEDISVWTEYLRVLQALGTRKTCKVAKHIVHLADKNNEQDMAELNFYCGCVLKEYQKYARASDHLFESAELGPPRLFQHIEVMFIVARNVNEADAKAKEKGGLHDFIKHDYSAVYQQFLGDKLIPPHVSYEDWLKDKKTWRLIAEKCSLHGMHAVAQDMLSQSLHFNETSYVDAGIWFRMAKLYFRSGRLPDALSCLAQSLSRDPGNRQYQTTREIWLAGFNTFEYAINVCSIDEILNMLPHPHDLHVPAANRLRALHKIAVKKWDKALRDKEAERLAALAQANYSGPSIDQDAELQRKKRVKDKSKKNPRILWRTPAPIVYPSKLTPKILSAIVKDIEGEFEYKPALHDDPLPAGTHRLFVEFVPQNTNKYNVVEAEVELFVEKATPFVYWTEPPFLYLGSMMTLKLHLNADVREEDEGGAFSNATPKNKRSKQTKKVSKKKGPTSSGDDEPALRFSKVSRMGTDIRVMGQPAGKFTYKVEGPRKLEIQPPGVSLEDIALPIGVHDLIVTFTPDDALNYTKATAKTQVRIIPRMVPVITWPTPEAIIYRTLLQPTQLNATCATTSGSFLYFLEIIKSERRRKVFGEVDGDVGIDQQQQRQQQQEEHNEHFEDAGDDEDESNFEIVEWAELEKIDVGSLLDAGDNKLVCVFEASDPVKYTNAEESVIMTVLRYQTTLAWVEPPCIYVGTPLDFREHLTARLVDDVDGDGSGKFIYTCIINDYVSFPAAGKAGEAAKCDDAAASASALPSSPSSISSSSNGADSAISGVVSLIGLLPKGHHELHCTYTPLDGSNHIGCSTTVSITVRCRPVIVWEKPEPIRYCVLISDTQYNASTPDCAGEFQYDPPLGAKLEIGHYMLKVVFLPLDPSVHDSSHAMVPLSVIRKLVPVLTWKVVDIVYGEAVDEDRVLCCTSNVPGTFKYNVALGQLLEAGSHSIITTFSPDDPVTYSSGSTVEQLIVIPQQIEIIWDPLCFDTGLMSISYGSPITEHQLCALVMHPAPEDIPSLFGCMSFSVQEGDLLQSGVHTITATFTPSPRYARNYYPATVSAELEVRRFTPKLRWSRPPDMFFGVGALSQAHLNAAIELSTFSVAVAGDDGEDVEDVEEGRGEWEPEHKSGYSNGGRSEQKRVLIEGVYSYMPNFGEALPSAGRHTLRVVFTPHDSFNFGSCEAHVDIFVARGRPTISWTPPEPIYWGQILSNRQLNATVSCPGLLSTDGELVFVPGRGEVLPVGIHILRVEFVPFSHADRNFDCKGCWGHVPLTVRPKAFNFESLDRLLLRKQDADMHDAMHQKTMHTRQPEVMNHPELPVKRAAQNFRPTSAPYATLHDRSRKALPFAAWPEHCQHTDDGSFSNSISISSTRRDDWRGKSVSMNSLLNASFSPYSPNESIVSNFSLSNFNNSLDSGERRRVSSANNLIGSPIKRGESCFFPPLFDEDGLLVRPVTAGSRVMAAAHTRRDRSPVMMTRSGSPPLPPHLPLQTHQRKTKSSSGVRSSEQAISPVRTNSNKKRVKSS